MADLTPDQARARALHAAGTLEPLLQSTGAAGAYDTSLGVVEVEAPEDLDAFHARAMELGFGDGLPLIPPTRERIERMLGAYRETADVVLGEMPPRYGRITARAIASCAVMAGCLPEYFPVVSAIVRAIMLPDFNLGAIQPTTHPVAPLAIVSGPIAERIGMNSGTDFFGPGNRPNASIGRAIRLCLRNIGGAFSAAGDMATSGSPAKYSYAIAENTAQSPWESLAASRGCRPEANCVTVFGATAPLSIHDNQSTTGAGLLRTISGSMRIAGLNNFQFDSDVVLLLAPEHAGLMAQDGYSREDVQRYLFAHARTPIDFFSEAYLRNRLQIDMPKQFAEYGPGTLVPLVQNFRDILIGVAGGPGKHSNFISSFGPTRVVTIEFD